MKHSGVTSVTLERSRTLSHGSREKVYRIKAAILRKRGGPLEIESIEMDGPRDDEVLVRIVASGICRTDIDFCDINRAMDDARRGDTIKPVLRIGGSFAPGRYRGSRNT